MYKPLVPCPNCDRHVKASEGACPFCQVELGGDLSARIAPSTTARLSRAAAFAFGVSVALTACGDDETTSSSTTGAGNSGNTGTGNSGNTGTGGDGTGGTATGGTGGDATGGTGGVGTGGDVTGGAGGDGGLGIGGGVALYGAPPSD